jgi:hypothetical protein
VIVVRVLSGISIVERDKEAIGRHDSSIRQQHFHGACAEYLGSHQQVQQPFGTTLDSGTYRLTSRHMSATAALLPCGSVAALSRFVCIGCERQPDALPVGLPTLNDIITLWPPRAFATHGQLTIRRVRSPNKASVMSVAACTPEVHRTTATQACELAALRGNCVNWKAGEIPRGDWLPSNS